MYVEWNGKESLSNNDLVLLVRCGLVKQYTN